MRLTARDLLQFLKDIPVQDLDMPVTLYTGWEGDQPVPASGVEVQEGELVDPAQKKLVVQKHVHIYA